MITGPARSVKLARKLRTEMSLPETLLWREFRKRPDGIKFRRQHPAGDYVLDFYCAGARLAIEIDGSSHDNAAAMAYDERRAQFLKSQGVGTMRVPAKAVLDNLDGAVRRIVDICKDRIEKVQEMKMRSNPPRNGEGDHEVVEGGVESSRQTPHLPLHHPAATGAPARPASPDGLPPASHFARLRPPPRSGEDLR
jgi:very-short-patch-repair endonuclease